MDGGCDVKPGMEKGQVLCQEKRSAGSRAAEQQGKTRSEGFEPRLKGLGESQLPWGRGWGKLVDELPLRRATRRFASALSPPLAIE